MTTYSFDYFEHGADIGVIGYGATVEAAFAAAAEAMFSVMAEIQQIRPSQSVAVSFDEDDSELALVRWLNSLLAEARAAEIVLGHFTVQHDDHHWHGAAWGEPWRDELERGVEVKGATLTMLSLTRANGGWAARCVVDV